MDQSNMMERDYGSEKKLQALVRFASQQEQVDSPKQKSIQPELERNVKLGVAKRKAHKASGRCLVSNALGGASMQEKLQIQSLEREIKCLRIQLESYAEENRRLKQVMEKESRRASSRIRSLENALEAALLQQRQQPPPQYQQERQPVLMGGSLLPNLTRLASTVTTYSNLDPSIPSHLTTHNSQSAMHPYPAQEQRQLAGYDERVFALQKIQQLENELQMFKEMARSFRH